MKFVVKYIQKLEPEQDRQTIFLLRRSRLWPDDFDIYELDLDTTYYYAIFVTVLKCIFAVPHKRH